MEMHGKQPRISNSHLQLDTAENTEGNDRRINKGISLPSGQQRAAVGQGQDQVFPQLGFSFKTLLSLRSAAKIIDAFLQSLWSG